jgi:hypothetical protein
MVRMNWPKRVLLFAVAAVPLVWPGVPGQAPARDQEARRLTASEFEKLHHMLKPRPGESRWMEIAWYPSVWEGRQKAAAEGKPLFLWAGSGGAPAAGC